MAALPTPPQPITAIESPRPTWPVLIAAPIPAITPQPSSPATSGFAAGLTFVHCPECTRVFSMKAPMPSAARELLARLQRHLLRGVVGVEAVPGRAAATRPAGAADRAPVEDHEVARRDVDHALADGLDDPGGLVAEQEREVVVDPALAVVQVGVAHPARLHLHHDLARPRIRDDDRLDGHRVTLLVRDDPADLLRHAARLLRLDSRGSLPRATDSCRRKAAMMQGLPSRSTTGAADPSLPADGAARPRPHPRGRAPAAQERHGRPITSRIHCSSAWPRDCRRAGV